MSKLLHRLHSSSRRASESTADAAREPSSSRLTVNLSAPMQRRLTGARLEAWLHRVLPNNNSTQVEPSCRRRKRDYVKEKLARRFLRKSPSDGSVERWPDPIITSQVAWEESDEPAIDELSGSYADALSEHLAAKGALDAYESSDDDQPTDPDDSDDGTEDGNQVDASSSSTGVDFDAFVIPPVQIPPTYRKQDRQGGTMVAGSIVIFTRAAFKRRLFRQGRLGSIPENCRYDGYVSTRSERYHRRAASDGVVASCVRM